MSDARVSVVLPTRNRAASLPVALESVVRQSFTSLEVIVVDDASTDHTAGILEVWTKKDPRIRVLRQDSSVGFPRALNLGMSSATGEYIARIDDDDEWIDRDKLKRQVEYLDSHPDCVLIGTAFEAVRPDGSVGYRINPPLNDADVRRGLLWDNPFGHSTVLFRKDAALSLGGYDVSLPYTEDYDLWLRLGQKGSFANLPQITVRYALGIGMSSANRRRQGWYRLRILREYGSLYPGLWLAYPRVFLSLIRSYLP